MKFLISKAFWINLLIAVALFFLSIVAVNFFLKDYTKHKESITVPDLTGFTIDELEEFKRDRYFKFKIIDTLYQPNTEPFAIIDQNPKPESKVKENRTIYLTINASKPPMKALPDLVGRSSYRNARKILENEGFQIGELIYKPHPYENEVLDVLIDEKTIEAGTMLAAGTKLDLVLGNGLSKEKVIVPRLIGMTYVQADSVIKDISLNMGSVIYDKSITDSASAVVYRQIPKHGPGNFLKLGEPIDIFLSHKSKVDTSRQNN